MNLMKTAVVMTMVILIITMFDLSKSLRCYECNVSGKEYDPVCEKMDKDKSKLVINCPEVGKKCGTIVTFGRYGENDIISRGCLNSNEARRCEELDDPSVSCEACDSDECNDTTLSSIG